MKTSSLQIDVLTLFPQMIEQIVAQSVLGRGQKKGAFSVKTHNIRNFASGSYSKVDDILFGGGRGMLMQCEPIWQCLQSVLPKEWQNQSLPQSLPKADEKNRQDDQKAGYSSLPRRIYLSPKGQILTQSMVKSLAQEERIILLCGHYEGIDERVIKAGGFEELSIGDYVLTGGELPAVVLIDAVARMLPSVLKTEVSTNETHMQGMLEACQYTRPASWRGINVPDVLLSGHHAKIEEYKLLSSLVETLEKRPDLFAKLELESEVFEKLLYFQKENKNKQNNNLQN